MDTQPDRLVTHVINEIAKALCDRPGETAEQRLSRTQATIELIMAFQPRNAIEAILAGRCVIFHDIILTNIHTTLSGETVDVRHQLRGGVIAMDRAFRTALGLFERYRSTGTLAAPDAKPAAKVESEPNTEALSALATNDPMRLAKALGLDIGPQIHAGNRQARRHPERYGLATKSAR